MPGFELIGKEEKNEINNIFDNGGGILFRHGFDNLRNDSFKVKEFEQNFSKYFKTKYSLAVTSGTAALRVALASLDLKKDDEVITQSFTFVATVEAIIESNAIPVCTEVDKTLNMDPDDLLNKINKKTKAVIVVHMLGVPCRLNEIKSICKKNNIKLIEDTAWGCGGKFNNRFLGTHGDIGTYSFDFAKTITTGEGGMVVFKNKKLFDKAAAWHDHGHENNPKLPRWEDSRSGPGFNYRMNELQGAVGIVQLQKLDKIIHKQRNNLKKIIKILSKFRDINIREVPKNSYETGDACIFFVDNKKTALKCREAFLDYNISTKILPEAYTWHFAETWDHMIELKRKHKDLKKSFPKSRNLLLRSVSIPVFYNMSSDFFNNIYFALKSVFNEK